MLVPRPKVPSRPLSHPSEAERPSISATRPKVDKGSLRRCGIVELGGWGSGCPQVMCKAAREGGAGVAGGGALATRMRRVGPLPHLRGELSEETGIFLSLALGSPWQYSCRGKSRLALLSGWQPGGRLAVSGQTAGLCRCEGWPGVVWVCLAPGPERQHIHQVKGCPGPKAFHKGIPR